LERHYGGDVARCQQCRKRSVDEGAVDDVVYVVEAVLAFLLYVLPAN